MTIANEQYLEDPEDEASAEEDHNLWPHARLGLLFLVDSLSTNDYRFEPTSRLMKACQLQSYSRWKKVHELMRDWLADRGYDLVNQLSRDGGYAIARQPVQTFKEILKSTFRALGHLGSANIRNDKLSTWLGQLPAEPSFQYRLFKNAMGYLMATTEQMKKNIREIERALPELGDLGDSVADVPSKLVAGPLERPKFIRPSTNLVADIVLEIEQLRQAILATRMS